MTDEVVYPVGLTFVAAVIAFFLGVEEWALAGVCAVCFALVAAAWFAERRLRERELL